MSSAVSKFITDLAMHFPPKNVRPEMETAWVRSMAESLRGFHGDVLDAAARRIIDTRSYTTFPLPADCREVCEAIKREREIVGRSQTLPAMRPPTGDEWSSERVKLAYDLLRSSMGKEAASGKPCWVLSLWNFCRKNRRLPQGHEVERCKRDAREFDEAYEDCVRGNAGLASKALEGLGASMIAKREKLRAEVLGK